MRKKEGGKVVLALMDEALLDPWSLFYDEAPPWLRRAARSVPNVCCD